LETPGSADDAPANPSGADALPPTPGADDAGSASVDASASNDEDAPVVGPSPTDGHPGPDTVRSLDVSGGGAVEAGRADVARPLDGPGGGTVEAGRADVASPIDTSPTIDCGPLGNPANGSVTVTTTTAGSTASYSCSIGYSLSQATARTCQADGTWSGPAPTCVLVDCGALSDPADGTVDATATTYGSTATYGCKPGFGPSGSSTRTCQADGTWSGTAPTCVVSDCPSLPGPAGGAVSAPTLTVGSTATYTCQTGHEMQGAPTRTCQAGGTWSGTAPTCAPVDCGELPPLGNGTVTATTTTYGSTAIYACTALGHQLSGSGTRTCQANKTWSGSAPICVPVDCGAPAALPNGTVTAPVTTYGSTATYGCTTTGYELSGSDTRTCLADKTWSGTRPDCVLVDCGGPDRITDGTFSATATTYGGTATYSCTTPGYVLSGNVTRTCQANKTWSGTAPSCVLVTCPALTAPANGTVDVPSRTYGATASFTCNPSFVMSGYGSATCQADGTWSHPKPTCECTDGLKACGSTCVDTQSNNSHCGDCNVRCSTVSPSTAQCSSGRCLITIAANENTPVGITTDATSIYWTTLAGSTKKAPIGGGPPTEITSGMAYGWGITVDSTNVYWTGDSYVRKAPLSGSPVSNFATGYVNIAWVFSNGTNVFWNNTGTSPSFTDSSLMKMSTSGGPATPLATGAVIGAFAVDASYVYYIKRTPSVANSGQILRVSQAGGAATPLASGQAFPYAIATDGSYLYWTNGDLKNLVKMSISGGAVTPLASSVLELGVTTDGSYVYYATTTNAVMKVSVNGGDPILLASGQTSPAFLKTDATSMYWTTEVNPGQVMKLTPK
jgi:CUB/sushi domain-containing protein